LVEANALPLSQTIYTSNKFFEKLPEFNHGMYGTIGGTQTLPVINK